MVTWSDTKNLACFSGIELTAFLCDESENMWVQIPPKQIKFCTCFQSSSNHNFTFNSYVIKLFKITACCIDNGWRFLIWKTDFRNVYFELILYKRKFSVSNVSFCVPQFHALDLIISWKKKGVTHVYNVGQYATVQCGIKIAD